jgi:condensin complex subunit 2
LTESQLGPDMTSQSLNLSMAGLSLDVKKEQPFTSKRIKPIPLIFARSAKRVDVSKLKENLWHKLSDDQMLDESLKANVTLLKEEKSFREIVTELDDCYEDKTRKDISVAFCFICVLHLANENNLKITGSEEMKELIISAV